MEEPKFDIMKLVKENFKSAPETFQPTFLSTYMLLHCEGDKEFILAEYQDIDRCTFIGDHEEDGYLFKDSNGRIIPCKKEEYRKRWAAIDTKSINGTVLEAAYQELAYMIENRLPPELKGKVKF